MDVIIVGPTLAGIFFLMSLTLWFLYARAEHNEEIRLKKKVRVFLIWFLLNWLYIMNQLFSPVWYEPDPVNPGLIALNVSLPLFIILSVPFIVDMINQWRLAQI